MYTMRTTTITSPQIHHRVFRAGGWFEADRKSCAPKLESGVAERVSFGPDLESFSGLPGSVRYSGKVNPLSSDFQVRAGFSLGTSKRLRTHWRPYHWVPSFCIPSLNFASIGRDARPRAPLSNSILSDVPAKDGRAYPLGFFPPDPSPLASQYTRKCPQSSETGIHALQCDDWEAHLVSSRYLPTYGAHNSKMAVVAPASCRRFSWQPPNNRMPARLSIATYLLRYLTI